MHELSVCQGIIEIATTALSALPEPRPRVSAIALRIGRLTGVVPDALRFHFALLSAGTALDGARLDIEEIPLGGRCAACGDAFQNEALTFLCPGCGSGFVGLVTGRELEVVSLDTAEAVACAG